MRGGGRRRAIQLLLGRAVVKCPREIDWMGRVRWWQIHGLVRREDLLVTEIPD